MEHGALRTVQNVPTTIQRPVRIRAVSPNSNLSYGILLVSPANQRTRPRPLLRSRAGDFSRRRRPAAAILILIDEQEPRYRSCLVGSNCSAISGIGRPARATIPPCPPRASPLLGHRGITKIRPFGVTEAGQRHRHPSPPRSHPRCPVTFDRQRPAFRVAGTYRFFRSASAIGIRTAWLAGRIAARIVAHSPTSPALKTTSGLIRTCAV